jgi:hypothetical protein
LSTAILGGRGQFLIVVASVNAQADSALLRSPLYNTYKNYLQLNVNVHIGPCCQSITMTVAYDLTHRGSSTSQSMTGSALEDRFEVLKDIGDGSFGSVVLARVRAAGSSVARRGTVVSFLETINMKNGRTNYTI